MKINRLLHLAGLNESVSNYVGRKVKVLKPIYVVTYSALDNAYHDEDSDVDPAQLVHWAETEDMIWGSDAEDFEDDVDGYKQFILYKPGYTEILHQLTGDYGLDGSNTRQIDAMIAAGYLRFI